LIVRVGDAQGRAAAKPHRKRGGRRNGAQMPDTPKH